MSFPIWIISSLALIMLSGIPAVAQQKIGVVQVQSAIVGTKEGQKAATDLETRMAPKRKDLEAKQSELQKLQASLQKPDLTEQSRLQLVKEIDSRSKTYKRSLEDAQTEFQGEQERLLNDLGAKLMSVISKYAKDNKYSLVIDISNPQTPVMYASDTIDITKAVVDVYDKNSASGSDLARPAPAPTAKVSPSGK